ncbi:Outer membrane lipoprotein-sorting protein [hydrothermal vent metagenome]|uniref:Outer membrane lipoprotein-sorting protein n=1 Tax=hydrothermal vent metagenome TaxID=652676 RepID=A0A3B0X404_9ZZZZ
MKTINLTHKITQLSIATLTGLALTLTSLSSVYADKLADDVKKGLEIAQAIDKQETGFIDSIANMNMILKNKQGQTNTRKVKVHTLEMTGDGDKGLSIFNTPRDIKGTAALTYSHSLKPDEQWIYLPALKRVKRISSKNKSGPFMGSEFAFEDISSQEVDKYTYKYIKDDVLEGIDSVVIERYPAYKHSGYTRQVVWVNKKENRVEKIVFYDRKNSLLKTLVFSGYKQYLNQFWRPDSMHMVNHQTKKSTTLNWENYQFKTGLTEKDFNRNSLKRAR